MPEASSKRGKILVVRGGAIGDFILTLPAIAALRNTFSSSHLEVLGYPKVAELARGAGLIDEFRSIEARALAGFFARNGKLDPELSEYFGSFALIFSYLYDPDGIFSGNVGLVSKAQFIQGPHRPNEKEELHAASVFLKPLEKMAIYDVPPMAELRMPVANPHGTPKKVTALHPGSGSESKNWPLENWVALIRELQGRGEEVLVIGGEADTARIGQIQKAFPGLNVIFNKPLAELAGVLAHCQVFIGHDSGISHIAAALGLRTLILWGPSNDRIWRPLNPNATVLKAADGNLATLKLQHVIEGLQTILR